MQHPETRRALWLKKEAFVCGATANNTLRIEEKLGSAGKEVEDKGYLILLVVVVSSGPQPMNRRASG